MGLGIIAAEMSRPQKGMSTNGDAVMNEPSGQKPKRTALGAGGWTAIVAMGVLLGASIWFAFYGWNLTDGLIDTPGMIALVAGVILSMALGGGLMALVFYSNRKGYDR
jgi:hypothetical protein